MPDDKAPLYLSLAAAVLLVAAVWTLQPYSADWPGTGFAKPAQRYVRAALAQDSAALARLSAADSPVTWALALGRRQPASLAAWSRGSQAFTGERHGDTTQVFVYSRESNGTHPECGDGPIELRFVARGNDTRVVGARMACLDSAPADLAPDRRGKGRRP